MLLLGDDDLTSVAISLLNTADKIQVVDIDEEVLTNLQKIVKKHNLPVEISQADFRTDKLENLKEQFDLIFTDPPLYNGWYQPLSR